MGTEMRVELGPVRSASAAAWLGHASSVLDRVALGCGPAGIRLPGDVLDGFAAYLASWAEAAAGGPTFRWTGGIDPEVAVYLMNSWFRLAESVAAEARVTGGTVRPPDGEEFFEHLLDTLLHALATTCRGSRGFAEHLGAFWPGRHQGAGAVVVGPVAATATGGVR